MKLSLLAVLLLLLWPRGDGFAQNQPLGWASANGGTTGGFGGSSVIVDNRDDFVSAVAGNDPTIIFVKDTIDLVLYERVDVGSNKTIFGFTENAMLRYGGLELIGNNIIVRNLVIGDFYDGDPTGTTNSTDCITVYGQNIWIDHCWFWAGADGLLDVRSGNGNIGNYVTVSYCRFSDHNKVSLIGSSNDSVQDRDHLKVTFHHCWFDGTVGKSLEQRNPRVRYGDVHVFNCYYEALEAYCIAARIESDVVVERNYFRDTASPHQIRDFGLGREDPDLVAIENIYELSWGDEDTHGEAFVPSDFYDYTPEPTWDVPQVVMNEAGPLNPAGNIPPTAVNDTVYFFNMSGGINAFVTRNDQDPDSDDLRLAQIVNQPAGIGFIKENKIIYAPPANASGIDSVAYAVVDTEGGVDTGYLLVFLDETPSATTAPNQSDGVNVFPNPANDTAIIELVANNSAEVWVQLLDAEGREVRKINSRSNGPVSRVTLDVQSLPAGNYFVKIMTGNKIYGKSLRVSH